MTSVPAAVVPSTCQSGQSSRSHELPAVVVDDGKGGAGAHFGKTCTRGLDGGLQQSVGPAVPIDGHGAQKGCSERGGRKDGERLTGRVSE